MIDLEFLKTQKLLGIGCSTFGGSSSKKVAERLLNHSFDQGFFYYDVARSYGYGQAESIVGKFAKDKRDKIIIASKFGIQPPQNLPFKNLIISGFRQFRHFIPKTTNGIKSVSGKVLSNQIFTPELATKSLDKSLKELRTDYLDIFLFHESRFTDMLLEDVIHVLEKEKDKGKIRAYGGTFKNRNDLLKLLQRPELTQIIQFPFGLDEAFYKVMMSQFHVQVIYSILNYNSDSKLASNHVLLKKVKIKFPELYFIENISELMLFVAFAELKAGVLLMSTKKINHIDRNKFLINQPFLQIEKNLEIKNYIKINFFDKRFNDI
jgi:aryl-alcohol dehydrogenase-like predicted oxidoreductase